MPTINDILQAHGIGGGASPFFGNGSDGTFNPALNSTSGNISFCSDNVLWAATGATNNPTGNNPGPSISVGLINAGPNAEQFHADTTNTYSVTGGYEYGSAFTVSSAIAITGIQVYVSAAGTGNTVTLYLYDVTNSVQIATGQLTAANGWNTVSFSKYTLQPNTTYKLSFLNNSSNAITVGRMATAPQSILYNVTQPTTLTFTAPTLDGAPVVKQFTSVNIPTGVTVTVDKRCQGLIMLVNGDVTINGTISMDGMGAMLDPTTNSGFAVPDKVFSLMYPISSDSRNNKVIIIGTGGIGGNGGYGGITATFMPAAGGLGTGGTWFGGGRGGGGAGGGYGIAGGNGGDAAYTGSGTAGTGVTGNATAGNAGTGGAGGSGSSGTISYTSGAGGLASGAGGGGGGGSDSTSGNGTSGSNSSGGAGGLILIIASGNITINSGAVLTAKGSSGANGGSGGINGSSGGGGGGGGGAGGGIIALLYRGTLTNSGTTNVSGGAGGTGGSGQSANMNGANGHAGGNGIVQTVKLS